MINIFPSKDSYHNKSCHLLSTQHMPRVELSIYHLNKSGRLVLSHILWERKRMFREFKIPAQSIKAPSIMALPSSHNRTHLQIIL